MSSLSALVKELRGKTGAGILDCLEIILIGQDAGMQRPLSAAPRLTGMNSTAIVIKYAMPVNSDHLDRIVRLPPVFYGNHFPAHVKIVDHSLLIRIIQGNGGFTLTAISALLTNKNIRLLHHQ